MLKKAVYAPESTFKQTYNAVVNLVVREVVNVASPLDKSRVMIRFL